MSTRKKISPKIQAEVLLRSRRRCCLCFGLERDFNLKKGQIAHVDKNNSNSNIDNLVFLCFNHHDEYDSQTSQSKGLSINELKNYNVELQKYISEWETQKRTDKIGISINKDQNYNEFTVYEMINPNSVCGYDFLAVNKTNTILISFGDSHINFQRIYWEAKQWLNCDYQRTGTLFQFQLSDLDRYIYEEFRENDYSLTSWFNDSGIPDSMMFTFNSGNQYYEVDFDLSKKSLKKTTNTGYQRIENEYPIQENPNLHFIFFDVTRQLILQLKNQEWIRK